MQSKYSALLTTYNDMTENSDSYPVFKLNIDHLKQSATSDHKLYSGLYVAESAPILHPPPAKSKRNQPYHSFESRVKSVYNEWTQDLNSRHHLSKLKANMIRQ